MKESTELARGRTFVAPGPDPQPQRITILPPAEQLPMQPIAQTEVRLATSYEDRARGFQLATVPIALAFGVGALVVAVVGWSIPAISLVGLAVFWLAFLGWWLVGWLIHHVASPDGVALLQSLLQYRYLRHEQRERLKRYKIH